MNKKIFTLILLLFAVILGGTNEAWGQYRPWQDYYRNNRGYLGSGNYNDAFFNILGDLDDLVGGGGTIDTGANVYFVDNNSGSNSDSGRSWGDAFLTITYAMSIAHANIGVSPNYADRIRIYVKGDDFDEDFTLLAQKTDIIGVGSDDGAPFPTILGNHVIDAQTTAKTFMGTRFFNMGFLPQTSAALWDIPANQHQIGFYGCQLQAGADSVIGIKALSSNGLTVMGCRFIRDVGNNYGFLTAAIYIDNGTIVHVEITNNWIDAEVGIYVDSSLSSLGCSISGNYIHATTFTIDENSDSFWIANNTLITDTTIAGGTDLNLALCVDNKITGSDGMKRIPLDASVSDIATSISNISGYYGVATTTTDTTTTTDDTMTGFHDEQFTTDYVLIVTHDAGGSQAAPEGEIVDITDYVASTGVFTHAALTAATTTGDRFLIARREDVITDGATLVSDPATGSLATFIAAGAGSSSLGTDLGIDMSLVDALGTDGVAALNTTKGILDAIGVNVAAGSTNFTSATATADRDGNVIERTEAIITMLETGTTNKLTAPANTYTILDILGSDGADASGAVAGSILGAIGTDEAASATAFSSSSVEDDRDGSALERLEAIDAELQYSMSVTRTKDGGTDLVSGTNNLFVVSGPIEVMVLVGIVQNTLKTVANDCKFIHTTTVPAGAVDITGALECTGDAAGTSYTLNTTIGGNMIATTVGTVATSAAVQFLAPAGTIAFVAAGTFDAGDSIAFYIKYKPLISGARVTASP